MSKYVKNFTHGVRYGIHEIFNTHEFHPLKSNSAKKMCDCGAEDWLFSKRYPKIDELKYSWKRMYPTSRL